MRRQASRTTIRVATIAMLVLAVPVPARADEAPPPPTGATAGAALEAAEQALDAAPTTEPDRAATPALNQLAAALPSLRGSERRRAGGLLARPTEGAADRFGDGYPAAAPVASAASEHFCVFWVNSSAYEDAPELADQNTFADGDGIPDYVEAILRIAEHSYSVEVAPGLLGWRAPKSDQSGCGSDPGARSDVYLKQLGEDGLFGYVPQDPNQGRARRQHGYMVLDNDYAPGEYGDPNPLDPASVTFAHEFNHLLQLNYDAFQDLWMFESTATWSEDYVFGEINDYFRYLPAFARNPEEPLTDSAAGRQLKVYGSAVWNHWLASGGGGYGVEVIPAAWDASTATSPQDFAVAAYGRGIRRAGGRGFSRELVEFAAATAEWRTGFGGVADAALYPEMKRSGRLERRAKSFSLDHTAYRLFEVKARRSMWLRVRIERGVRAGIALVARTGNATTGTVESATRYLDRGGRGSVRLTGLDGAARVTAVLINADGRERGFDRGDWVYRNDNARFKARLSG